MGIAFTVVKSRQTLEKQWKYMAERGVNNLVFLKKFLRVLIVATVVCIVFFFLTSADDFIVLKAVAAFSIFIGWVAIIFLSAIISFRNIRNNRRLNTFLNTITPDQLSYDVLIDDHSVKITSAQTVIESPWSQFTTYGIHGDTLYVYNNTTAMHTLYWDVDEIGNDNYLALINLIKQKSIRKIF